MNGAPITGGYRIKPAEEKKAKFRSAFWGFAGRTTERGGGVGGGGGAGGGGGGQSGGTSGGLGSPALFAPTPRPVFGVSLQEAVSVARVHEGLDLPAIVFRCVEFLEAKGAIEEEGIYRLSGSSVIIKGYKERFNTEGDFNLLESSKDEYHDVHAVAGLLKQFLRELASPILTRELHGEFLKVIGSSLFFFPLLFLPLN
jgi:RalA-binding protein 1